MHAHSIGHAFSATDYALTSLLHALGVAQASARARRGDVKCSCMGLNPTEALVQHTAHLERIEQASKASAGADIHMSMHGLPRLAFNSTLRPPNPPLPPFRPRDFLSVSQNFCPRASHLAHCVRTLTSLRDQVKSLSKVVAVQPS